MTVEEHLEAWASQSSTCVVTNAEKAFIDFVRIARRNGVGFGWMMQIIEWEWGHVDSTTTHGPGYFRELLAEEKLKLRKLLAAVVAPLETLGSVERNNRTLSPSLHSAIKAAVAACRYVATNTES